MLSGHQAMVIALTCDGGVYHYPHCVTEVLEEAQALAARPRASYGPYTWEVYDALTELECSPMSRYEVDTWASENIAEEVDFWMSESWEELVKRFGEPMILAVLNADDKEQGLRDWLYDNLEGAVICDECLETIE